MSEQPHPTPPPQPTPGDNIIPPHCNPIQFMMAQAQGDAAAYRPLASLEEAQSVDHGVMTMIADSGGQVLLSIPAKQVRADAPTLKQLLSDLEAITWGSGFDAASSNEIYDAAMYFQVAPPGTGLWGGSGGGLVTDGLWLHDELEDLNLRGQITRILSAFQPRLDLPHHFPRHSIRSLAAAKAFPRAQVSLQSGRENRPHAACPASMVGVSDGELLTLITLIDEWSAKMWPQVVYRDTRSHTVQYSLKGGTYLTTTASNRNTLRLGFTYLEPVRPQIEAMLRGTRPMIPIE